MGWGPPDLGKRRTEHGRRIWGRCYRDEEKVWAGKGKSVIEGFIGWVLGELSQDHMSSAQSRPSLSIWGSHPFLLPPTAIILFNPLSSLAKRSATFCQTLFLTSRLSLYNLFSIQQPAWDCPTRDQINVLPFRNPWRVTYLPLAKMPDSLASALIGPIIRCVTQP